MSSTIKLGDIPPPCNAPSGGPGSVEGCPTCKRQNWGGKLVVLDVDSWKMGEGGKRGERESFAVVFSVERSKKERKKETHPSSLAPLHSPPPSAFQLIFRQPRLPLRSLCLRLLLLLQQVPRGHGLGGADGQRLHLLRQPGRVRRELRRLHSGQSAARRQQGPALLRALCDGAQVRVHLGQQVPVPDVQLQAGRRRRRRPRVDRVDFWPHCREARWEEVKKNMFKKKMPSFFMIIFVAGGQAIHVLLLPLL